MTHQLVPGLAVWRGGPSTAGVEYCWYVGHHSGRAIAAFASGSDAEAGLAVVADFTDWTRSVDEIRADTTLNTAGLRDLVNHHTYGVFLHDRPLQTGLAA